MIPAAGDEFWNRITKPDEYPYEVWAQPNKHTREIKHHFLVTAYHSKSEAVGMCNAQNQDIKNNQIELVMSGSSFAMYYYRKYNDPTYGIYICRGDEKHLYATEFNADAAEIVRAKFEARHVKYATGYSVIIEPIDDSVIRGQTPLIGTNFRYCDRPSPETIVRGAVGNFVRRQMGRDVGNNVPVRRPAQERPVQERPLPQSHQERLRDIARRDLHENNMPGEEVMDELIQAIDNARQAMDNSMGDSREDLDNARQAWINWRRAEVESDEMPPLEDDDMFNDNVENLNENLDENLDEDELPELYESGEFCSCGERRSGHEENEDSSEDSLEEGEVRNNVPASVPGPVAAINYAAIDLTEYENLIRTGLPFAHMCVETMRQGITIEEIFEELINEQSEYDDLTPDIMLYILAISLVRQLALDIQNR